MTKQSDRIEYFHPLITEWFHRSFERPTEIQKLAWPRIAAGGHVLLTAPTGSGKTLTAFLWALDRLLTGVWKGGRPRVLYISPLKALNTDIRRNLTRPLREIERCFQERGEPCPSIRVMTRSGDTPQSERRRMLRHPPEILITTPESLNLLLSSRSGRSLLTGLKTVILDEIHTVIGNKRGVHLITAVERLVPFSGEFQRIAISATVRPMSMAAEFVGGFRMIGGRRYPEYRPRPVQKVKSESRKEYDLQVRFPQAETDSDSVRDFQAARIQEFRDIIERNESTLFFARSRRESENLTLKLNRDSNTGPFAYSHHGSLARELRRSVEMKLKSGELRAIVATSSLELGIDIGALDEVVLVQAPPSISSAIQRIGRSGHDVGETSRGTFYPFRDLDIIESAVLAHSIVRGDIEPIHPIEGALDVLAQVLISMTLERPQDIDHLYARIRSSWPYRRLPRRQFDLVLEMLGGRYADSRIRELKPSLSIDGLENTVAARRGARLHLYFSGGTIPDRGHYRLRHAGSGSLIGELDEEFVWEAKIGQKFNFGAQRWKIRRITHNDVFADTITRKTEETPFWRAEAMDRDFHLSRRIAEFMECAENNLGKPGWSADLQKTHFLDRRAAEALIAGLEAQKKHTGAPLPHRRHLLVEHIRSGPGGVPGNQIFIHTLWGGRVNRPFALAMESAWEERFGQNVEIYAGNDGIVLLLPQDIPGTDLMSLVRRDNLDHLLRGSLENSGFFGARFRENAGRALLITRNKPGERLPLWMIRRRSQKLFHAVRGKADFPLMLETWRSCLQDEFDMTGLREVLAEVEAGVIRIGECSTRNPSPLASRLSWAQINTYMYADDSPRTDRSSSLRSDLLEEVVFSPGLRPTVPAEIVLDFENRRRRLAPGYPPRTARELVDWVKERVWVPDDEWASLTDAMRRDLESAMTPRSNPEREGGSEQGGISLILEEAETGLLRFENSATGRTLTTSRERGAKDSRLLSGEFENGEEDYDALLTSRLGEWLSFYGPIQKERIQEDLGILPERLDRALVDLRESDSVISGRLVTEDSRILICDAANFETLLRMTRAASAPRIRTRPVQDIPLFLATYQGLVSRDGIPSDVRESDPLPSAFESLLGLPLPARLWEAEILPARISAYSVERLDAFLRESGIIWRGSAYERIYFGFEEEMALVEDGGYDSEPPSRLDTLPSLFLDPEARYDFATLLSRSGMDPPRFEKALWDAVWAGRITGDAFSAVHHGLLSRFRLTAAWNRRHPPRSLPGRRTRLRPRRGLFIYPGAWRILSPMEETEIDPIEREERGKDRVRLLLDRYGLIFRELLERESPPFRWPRVFRSLRLMELSGEILSGYFFEGIPGPQFLSRKAYEMLKGDLPQGSIYWMSAVDPASPCGLGLEGWKTALPRRVESTHLVFRGNEPVLLSLRRGADLRIHLKPGDSDIARCFGPLHHLLDREFSPLKRILVETVNGEKASDSPYLAELQSSFDTVRDLQGLSLYSKRV